MINKNQYKVRNVKKVLHKVGKKWLVMSTALLGMVAGGAAAGTATHADTTPANANHSDGYVNHQMTQSAGTASPQLVHSDGTSLASASASSSVASNNVSPSALRSTVSMDVAPSASSQENDVNSESVKLNHITLGTTPKAVTSTSSDNDNYLNLNGFNSLVSQMVTGYFPYPEFSNYIENYVYKDIANNRNVNDFLSEAASQVNICFRTAPRKDNYHLIQPIKNTINNTLSSLGKSPEFSNEYGSLAEGAICPFLRNLGSITSDNLVGPLSSIASYTSINAVNIPGFGEIASDAKSLANNASLVNEVHQHRVNEFNNEASKINNQHFVNDTINAIIHLPSSKAKPFKSLCSDLNSYINSPNLSSFVTNTLSNPNLSAFTDSYAKNIHELLNILNNSDVESLYKKDYGQFHENRGNNIKRLLVRDLANVAGNNNRTNVANALKDFNYSISTWGLTSSVPWMKNIYNGINDYLNSLKPKKSTTSASNNSVINGKSTNPSDSTQSSSPSGINNSSDVNSGDKSKSALPSNSDNSTGSDNHTSVNSNGSDGTLSGGENGKSSDNTPYNHSNNNETPQTSSPDDNNSELPSVSNDNGSNNNSDSSNSASQPQFSFTNNASTSSAVKSSASASTKFNVLSISDVNQLSVGQRVDYHGMVVTRKRPTYRWFEISKTCLAHSTLDSIGKVKDYGAVLNPGMKVRLNKVFKINVNHRTLYRYEININGHNYFVTGNHEFTNDAYYQTGDLRGHRAHGRYGHRYFEAIVKKPFLVYDSYHFTKDNQLWKSRRGQLIDIKGVHRVGNVTRLALIDGTYITANREFLKLI